MTRKSIKFATLLPLQNIWIPTGHFLWFGSRSGTFSVVTIAVALAIVFIPTITFAQTSKSDPYAKARSAHFAGKFEEAIGLYQQVEGSGFEAAQCYEAQCLSGIGRREEAIKVCRGFLQNSGFQTYRGEVVVELVRMLCLLPQESDGFKEAEQRLEEIEPWLRNMEMDSVKGASDFVNRGSPALVDAQFDVAKTPWFRPAIKTELYRFRIYVAVCRDKRERAMQALNDFRETQGLLPRSLRADLSTLDGDISRGSFFLPPLAWRSLTAENRNLLCFAFFLLATGSDELAEPMFRATLAKTADGAGKASDWAAAEIGLAACEYLRGDTGPAIKRLGQFQNTLRGTEASRFGRLLLANIQAAEPTAYNAAIRLYGDLMAESGQEPSPPAVMLSIALAAANQNDTATLNRMAEQLKTKYAATSEAALATKILECLMMPKAGLEVAAKAPRPQAPLPGKPPYVGVAYFSFAAGIPESAETPSRNVEGPTLIVYDQSFGSAVPSVQASVIRPVIPLSYPQAPFTSGRRVFSAKL